MRNVKSTIAIIFSMLVVWSISCDSMAEERMITFEMGESGHTVSFPMTQKEILEAERVDKAIEEINQRKRSAKKTWEESYELAESGITINFPLSDEETSNARSRYQELVRHHEKMSQLQQETEKKFEIFEFGEGGHTVRFLKSVP